MPLATAQETTPVDGELPPTEAPYVDVPADKPALVAVSLQADLTVMMPGDVATITVEVRPLSDESAAGQILTLTLPDQLKPKDPKQALSWTLPDLNQDVLFSQQISLQLKEVGTALKEGVVEMSASVAPTGKWATTTTLLRLGVTKNGNRKPVETTTESTQGDDGTVLIGTQGAVTLLVQPASAQSGTLFRYTELHRWENAAVQTATPQAVAAASAVTMTAEISSTLAVDLQPTELQPLTNQFIPLTKLYMPMVLGGTSGTQTQATGEAMVSASSMPVEGVSIDAPADTAADITVDTAIDPAIDPEPPLTMDGIGFYYTWQFQALENGAEITQFDQAWPEVIIDASWLADQGIDPVRLDLYTRASEAEEWHPVYADYDEETKSLSAQLPHFSEYGLGIEMSIEGDYIPSTSNFGNDLFTGASTIQYPIDLPSGPRGMTPSLNLSYSSGTVDDLFWENDIESTNNYRVQAGLPGLGWSLGGVGYIARTDRYLLGSDQSDDIYYLVVDGVSTEIQFNKFSPEAFVQVTKNLLYLHTDEANRGRVKDAGTWTVKSKDGMIHTFGSTVDPRPTTAGGYPTAGSGQNLLINIGNGNFEVNKWYLTESMDTTGNFIRYGYEYDPRHIRPTGGNNCPGITYYNNTYYYRSVRPKLIEWGGHKNTATGVIDGNPTMRAVLDYEGRTDYQLNKWNDGCIQTMWSDQRLKAIRVEVNTGGSWYPLREYQLGYTYSTGIKTHSLLSSIKNVGFSNATTRTAPLNTYSFTYSTPASSKHFEYYLATANNGWGGSSAYTYQIPITSHCFASDSSQTSSSCSNKTFRRQVSKVVVNDGVGNSTQTDYTYDNSLQRKWRGIVTFLGHSRATVSTKATGSATSEVKMEEVLFYQGAAGSPDPRLGRTYQSKIFRPGTSGCGSAQIELTRCRVSTMASTWTALTTNSAGAWVEPGTAATFFSHPRWVRLDTAITTVEDSASASASNRTDYFYQAEKQNGYQFGNVTQINESGGGLLRETYTYFYPNVTTHVVDKPSRVRVFQSGACLSESRIIYDGTANTYQTPPSKGLVYKTENRLTGDCKNVHTPTIDTYDAAWAITCTPTTWAALPL